jgi:hypothetical protein
MLNMNILGYRGYTQDFSLNVSDIQMNKSNALLQNNKDYSMFCELEYVRSKWRDIQFFHGRNVVLARINNMFKSFFEIKNGHYDDVGYYLFKFEMIARVPGRTTYSREIGLDIIIKGEYDVTVNEVKKNDLLFEKINFLELRVGDTLIFYISHGK